MTNYPFPWKNYSYTYSIYKNLIKRLIFATDELLNVILLNVNSILKNFISVSTYKSYIEKALKDGKYMINETKSNIRLSYLLTNEYDDYYSLNIIVE